MRVVMEFQCVGHDDEVDAIGRERQLVEAAEHVYATGFPGDLAQRDAIVCQKVDPGQPELQRVVSEQIAYQGINAVLFPCQDVAALWCLEPSIDVEN